MNKLQHFFEGYLWGYMMILSVPVGALGIRLIHVLTKGAWGEPLKRYYLAATNLWWLALALSFPLAIGFKRLYMWATPQNLLSDPHLAVKRFYLNVPFFIVRMCFYFGIWIGSTFWLNQSHNKKDISGLLAVLYVLVGSFFGIDTVMSLNPHWYSTIFGLLFVVGQVLLSFCVLICLYIFKENPLINNQTSKCLKDQGNLILTLVMLWAYLAFSQYLIIWMGNIPEEIKWYLSRIRGGWGTVAGGLIIGHFFVPFMLLLRRAWKEQPYSLALIALFILVMRSLDLGWMIFPGLGESFFQINWIHLCSALLVIGIFSICLRWELRTNERRTY